MYRSFLLKRALLILEDPSKFDNNLDIIHVPKYVSSIISVFFTKTAKSQYKSQCNNPSISGPMQVLKGRNYCEKEYLCFPAPGPGLNLYLTAPAPICI